MKKKNIIKDMLLNYYEASKGYQIAVNEHFDEDDPKKRNEYYWLGREEASYELLKKHKDLVKKYFYEDYILNELYQKDEEEEHDV